MDEVTKEKVRRLVMKKVKQIEDFHDKNYVDYRAPMILKSRKLLYEFLTDYANEFTNPV